MNRIVHLQVGPRSLAIFGLLLVMGMCPLMAQIPLVSATAQLDREAQPDECFAGVGQNLPFTRPPCTFPSVPKVNQGYIWGMTASGTDIWFGTLANGNCITEGGLALQLGSPTPAPVQTVAYACEFGSSPYVSLGLPPALGDYRPPHMYRYNTITHGLTDVTPSGPYPFDVDPLVTNTIGIRAATNFNNVVFFAGPSLLGTAINIFAFDATTHGFIGETSMAGYDDIRQFTVLNGQLYAAVGKVGGGGGSILKWTGIGGPFPCRTCFNFGVVGNTDGFAAYITSHKGYLWVTTWPTGVPNVLGSLFRSPLVPATGGLTTANANQWTKVWTASDYEPDPAIAATYAGGAIASHGGQLYWSTIHIPFLSTAAVLAEGAPLSVDTLLNSMRAGVIFRANGPDISSTDVELLYGDPLIETFQLGNWIPAPNNMPPGHKIPTFGSSGFGNKFNAHIWSMAEWNSRLWVGTMDWSLSAVEGLAAGEGVPGFILPPSVISTLSPNFGADLFSFGPNNTVPATLENQNGVGNINNYGIRNMVPVVNGNLFLGMANPANLLTNPFPPNGGWELIEVH